MDPTVSPQNSYVEALAHNVTTFRNRSLQDVIKGKWSHKDEVLILSL